MASVRDLITRSFKLIGVLAEGETPSAGMQTDALTSLNEMLSSWSTESLIIFERVREAFSLTPGKRSYTMGPIGDFATTKPMEIERATLEIVTSTPSFEMPVEILNLEQWADIPIKGMDVSLPTKLYPEMNHPAWTLNLWPGPSEANKLVLYSSKALLSFADPNATIDLPDGYGKALRYGLALELAPEYGKQVDELFMSQFNEAKSNIKRANIRDHLLGVENALLPQKRGFNWRTGE